MSAPARPSRMSRNTSTPNRSIPGGSRGGGATSRASTARAQVPQHSDTEPLDPRRQQGGGRDDAHPRAQRVEQKDIRARHPRMQDVAADGDGEAGDLALAAADRERVEQRLGRMFVL